MEECEITKMVASIDPKTREKKKVRKGYYCVFEQAVTLQTV